MIPSSAFAPSQLPAAALALPVVLAVATLAPALRRHGLALLPLAPLAGLLAALAALVSGPLAFDAPGLRLSLRLDAAGALLTAAASLVWIFAGAFALAAMRAQPGALRFAVTWLLTLAGGLGVFMAADLLSFYLLFALVSVPAVGLIIHDGDAAARRASAVYLAFAILGESVLLLGFVLLAAGEPHGSIAIADVMAALPRSPFAAPALALTIAGFAMKMAIAPMNGFMPLAYTAAPIAAAAALSGAAVKAGVIGLVRFSPFESGLPGLSEALTAAGLFSAFYGVAIGVTQRDPKTILAYSSISQMGVIAAVFGMGLSAGDSDAALQTAFYGANHALIKGALFLAVGAAAVCEPKALRPLVLAPALLLALSLGGLPLTGGALAKLAVKDLFGNYVVGLLAALSAAGTTLLMLHFVGRLAESATAAAPRHVSAPLIGAWLAAALGALVVPWALFPVLQAPLSDALNPYALLEGTWPALVGALLALALRRFGDRLPRIPAGDVLILEEAGLRALGPLVPAMERVERASRRWPAAALMLVGLVVLFLGAAAARGPTP